ncbi:NADPH-quinone reductase [Frankia canadensis]|uniref:NADPH-quinone reductase n=1 Tax=Frankia canadensis TaxID=1836972 RepID=A0A2I2KMQ9_9ACTN|nr:NADP-dependent oxidoreductase [Frankia canadensis]SNQ46957.1 NADPH-quinone reductase [Frankia canadensis]SOU54247.1 NADPH-quinone reductase [Frankia canadensis]
MKSIRVHHVGSPHELQLEEVERPEAGAGEVLVEVHAAGVNPPDLYARAGYPQIPADFRPPVPLPLTPGTDVSGVVVGVGGGVTSWAEGDEVLGLLRFPTVTGSGRGYAQYTTAPAGDLARKPAGIDHVHAAAVPMAGLTAWQFLADIAPVSPGETVLVNGAAGGVGHFLVQLARRAGARVIAVASTRHEAFLRGLGADEYIDYTTTRVADVAKEVDVLFDTVGGPHGHLLTPAIRDGGRLVPIFFGDYHDDELARRGVRHGGGQVRSHGGQLAELVALIDEGEIRVAVDEVFPLAEAWRAHERAERGHIQGKIVLRVDHPS